MNTQGPDILFHITDENYNFYQPDDNGLIIAAIILDLLCM
jgi:hypothetical protein